MAAEKIVRVEVISAGGVLEARVFLNDKEVKVTEATATGHELYALADLNEKPGEPTPVALPADEAAALELSDAETARLHKAADKAAAANDKAAAAAAGGNTGNTDTANPASGTAPAKVGQAAKAASK